MEIRQITGKIRQLRFRPHVSRQKIILVGIGLTTVVVTVFIFLSSYEFIFNRDILYLASFNATPVTEVLNYTISQSVDGNYYFTSDNFLKNKKLEFIELPVVNRKLEVARAVNENGEWFVKGNKANYFLIVNPNKSEAIVMYMDKSWRTIPNSDLVKEGDLMYVTTDDEWVYVFRITSIQKLTEQERFVSDVRTDLGIIMILDDSSSGGYTVVQSQLISSHGQ